jgi:formylglycine-generating enzyme required for sulfatase activity
MWIFLRLALTRLLHGRPRGGPMARVPGQTVELNIIPGRRRRRVGAFELDLHPVTNADWLAFCQATGHPHAPWMFKPGFSEPEQPVVGVTANEARAYARWARKRLPTEAEWLAAAGPHSYPWGTNPATPTRALFRSGLLPSRLAETGSAKSGAPGFATVRAERRAGPGLDVPPTGPRPDGVGPYGHHDLVGLVWEHLERLDGQPGSVARGGFWGSVDPRRDLRLLIGDNERTTGIGFRCAR